MVSNTLNTANLPFLPSSPPCSVPQIFCGSMKSYQPEPQQFKRVRQQKFYAIHIWFATINNV